eukprot:Seg1481.3 transcript_id=Seg1481.3/GoldUCD/mRNA.D3Y31 product="Craniofacial development protein 2" protein_id=Seg1481.3/GoldUCD/D3Y31
MGDLNAKVGEGKYEDIVGSHGLGERNDRSDKWSEWCKEKNQIILKTVFQQHPRRLWTWKSPRGNVKNQIDYVTINKRYKNAVKGVKCYPGADYGSGHSLLARWMKMELRRLKKGNMIPRYQFEVLANNREIQENYNVVVRNRYEGLQEED